MAEVERGKYLKPFPYGDDFESIEQLFEIVEARKKQSLQVYGHAVCFIGDERIAARS